MAAVPDTAALRADKLETVVVAPPDPPVVPPLRVAYPTSPALETLG